MTTTTSTRRGHAEHDVQNDTGTQVARIVTWGGWFRAAHFTPGDPARRTDFADVNIHDACGATAEISETSDGRPVLSLTVSTEEGHRCHVALFGLHADTLVDAVRTAIADRKYWQD